MLKPIAPTAVLHYLEQPEIVRTDFASRLNPGESISNPEVVSITPATGLAVVNATIEGTEVVTQMTPAMRGTWRVVLRIRASGTRRPAISQPVTAGG